MSESTKTWLKIILELVILGVLGTTLVFISSLVFNDTGGEHGAICVLLVIIVGLLIGNKAKLEYIKIKVEEIEYGKFVEKNSGCSEEATTKE